MATSAWPRLSEMWRDSLEDFSALTGMSLAILDVRGERLAARAPHGFCAECIGKHPHGIGLCRQAAARWISEARETRASVVYTCPLGLVEFVTPVFMPEGDIVGLIGGQVVLGPEGSDGPERNSPTLQELGSSLDVIDAQIERGELVQVPREWYERLAARLDCDSAELIERLAEVPRVPAEKVRAAAKMLHRIASTVSRSAVQPVPAKGGGLRRRATDRFEWPEAVGSKILDYLRREVTDFTKASLQILRGDTRILLACSGFDRTAPNPLLLRPVSQDELVRRVITSREPVVLPDVREEPYWEPVMGTDDVSSWIGLPLIVNDDVVGIITLDHNTPGYFTAALVEPLKGFARRTATAVAQTCTLFEAEHRIRDLRILSDMAEAAAAGADVQELLDTVVARIARELECTHCTIFLREQVGGVENLVPKAAYGGGGRTRERVFAVAHGMGIAVSVLNSGAPRLVFDARTEPDFLPAREQSVFPRAMVLAPIKVGDQSIGVISADQDVLGWFTESDRRLLGAIGNEIGAAIQRSQSLALLHQLGEQILMLRDRGDILKAVVVGAITVLNVTTGVIYLLSDDGRVVEQAFHPDQFDHPAPRLDSEEGLTRTVWREGEPIFITDTRDDPRVNPVLKRLCTSMAAVPIRIEGKTLGVFFLDDRDRHDFTPFERGLLRMLAHKAAIAIQNAAMLSSLNQALADRDVLESVLQEFVEQKRDPKTTLDTIGAGIVKLLGDQVTPTINLYDAEAEDFQDECHAYGPLADELRAKPRPDGLGRYVIRKLTPLYLPRVVDVPDGCPAIRPEARAQGIVSIAALPLGRPDRPVGVLFVNSQKPLDFPPDVRRALERCALQAGVAIGISRREGNSVRKHTLHLRTRKREAALTEYFRNAAKSATVNIAAEEPVLIAARRWNSWYPSFFQVDGGAYAVLGGRGQDGSTPGAIIDPGFRALATLRACGVPVVALDRCIVTHNHPDHVGGLMEYLAVRHQLGQPTQVFAADSVIPITRDFQGSVINIRNFDTQVIDLVPEFLDTAGQRRRMMATPFQTRHDTAGPSDPTRAVLLRSEIAALDGWHCRATAILLGDTEYRREAGPDMGVFEGIRAMLKVPKLRVLVLHIGSAQMKWRTGGHLYLFGLIDILKELEYQRAKQDQEGTEKLLVLVSEWGLEHATHAQVVAALPAEPTALGPLGTFDAEGLILEALDVVRSCVDLTTLTLLPADLGLVVGIESGCVYIDGVPTPAEQVEVGVGAQGLVYQRRQP
jgi:GAF domain-containing protein